MGGKRFYAQVTINKLYTAKSGEFFTKEGEWYFDTNGARFPSKGEFFLGANESLEFCNPKPTIFSEMLEQHGKEYNLHFRVRERDVLSDDTYLDQRLNIPWGNYDQEHEFTSKDGKVKLNIRVLFVERPSW